MESALDKIKQSFYYMSLLEKELYIQNKKKETRKSKQLLNLSKDAKNSIWCVLTKMSRGFIIVDRIEQEVYDTLSKRLAEIEVNINRATHTDDKRILNKKELAELNHEKETIIELLTEMAKTKECDCRNHIITMNGKYATSGLTIQQIYEKDANWIEFIARKSRSRHIDAEKIKCFYANIKMKENDETDAE